MTKPPPDPLFVLRGCVDAVNTVKFYSPPSTHKDYLISGCAKGEVKVWNLFSRRSEVTLNGHQGKGILHVQVLGDNSILSHGRDNKIHVWDVGCNSITASLEVPSLSFCKCAIISGGQGNHLVAVAGRERSEVKVYYLETGKIIHQLIPPTGHKSLGMPMSLKFIDSRQLFIGYEDGSVLQWSLETNKIMAENQFHSEPVMCLNYSASSGRGVSGSADDKLVSWTSEKEDLHVLSEVQLTNSGLSDVCIRQDNKIIATAGWDSRIRIFGFKKLKPLALLAYHTGSIHCVDFSLSLQQFRSQHLLAAGSKDKHISIWSVYDTRSFKKMRHCM